LNKLEKKLLKLNRKAEKAITHKKALKILKKYEKTRTTPQDPTGCHNTPV
tara:strand:+ start:241 stop:390 length:150 start_codon:yes stop_codon:yes gene_type:complete